MFVWFKGRPCVAAIDHDGDRLHDEMHLMDRGGLARGLAIAAAIIACIGPVAVFDAWPKSPSFLSIVGPLTAALYVRPLWRTANRLDTKARALFEVKWGDAA